MTTKEPSLFCPFDMTIFKDDGGWHVKSIALGIDESSFDIDRAINYFMNTMMFMLIKPNFDKQKMLSVIEQYMKSQAIDAFAYSKNPYSASYEVRTEDGKSLLVGKNPK